MSAPQSYVALTPGDPAPWFIQRATGNPRYAFDTAAGRYLVLCFYASASDPAAQAAIRAAEAASAIFDDDHASFFGVTLDPRDAQEGGLQAKLPGVRHFFDLDGQASRLYGAIPRDAEEGGQVQARRFWIVLDPTMRVLARIPFAEDGADRRAALDLLGRLPHPRRFAGVELQAPVLFLPNVFEPGLCRRLIDYYEEKGGQESGFMRQVDGKTVAVHDHSHKRRRDAEIDDPELKRQLQLRIQRRVAPEILKAHAFKVTRMERYIVGCYTADDGGHFRAHRDNTTSGTAHRRFAVSINLNADFEGGEVSFPEYGPRSFKPPPGGAVVFSCSFLHAVSRVTCGKRYAFLPFLYDEAAARLREQNAGTLEGGGGYRANAPGEERQQAEEVEAQ
ncbi:2OG-Fe(II) oxygenase family protein [Hansschlegelia zhihuaiae]|uniref:2OG-Fe(II) oxygenase n=1 Tax=Hansschlegelia zhihuaiae TaxID=405005 RepID=A0A4Q0M9M1_9HYPH|nr:2OG-Fe(II) oxygenase [Hansschlegelia zhihuaiae]RXF69910.1 2OG-Fe(II) oxygenase [Hansschlegelia zhihuaiae]